MPSAQDLIAALQGQRRYPQDDPVAGVALPTGWLGGQQFTQEAPKSRMRDVPHTELLEHMAKAFRDRLMTPGEVFKGVHHATPGMVSDEEMAQELALQGQAQRFGPDQAMAMVGGGIGRAPIGAAGTSGGRLTHYGAPHPQGTLTVPPYYSAAARTVAESKMPKGTAEQWAGYLRNAPGVKQEELQAAGLPGYLSGQTGAVTREQLGEHLTNQGVKLGEVNKSREGPKYSNFNDAYAADPKFSQYQLPGGTNYGEKLLTLPPEQTTQNLQRAAERIYPEFRESGRQFGDLEPAQQAQVRRDLQQDPRGSLGAETQFQSSHWDEPNVLVHVRHNDRVIPGAKPGDPSQRALFLEELQSDWHQQGRKRGYANQDAYGVVSPDGQTLSTYSNRDMAHQAADAQGPGWWVSEKETKGVPDAPFKQTWPDLALKRMVRQAAEGDYDAVAWTPGDVQADRYDLSKQINNLNYRQDPTTGTYGLSGEVAGSGGRVHDFGRQIPEKQLADHVGKDIAEKIVNGEKPTGVLSGTDLKVGGEGMRAFYDKMLVDKANALGKKYGAKVEQRDMPTADRELTDSDMEGLEAETPEQQAQLDAATKETPTNKKAWVLPITPELKKQALEQGFPLFSAAGAAGAGAAAATQPQQPAQVTVNPAPGYYEQTAPWVNALQAGQL